MKTDIGITGTRNGLSRLQLLNATNYLKDCKECVIHHGDCVGVDEEIAKISGRMNIKTVSHPPDKDVLRAFHDSDIILDAKEYLSRNKDIVNECDVLLVFPKENKQSSKGGTWYTYKYANNKNKNIIIFYPNGTIVSKNQSQDVTIDDYLDDDKNDY